MSGILDKKHKLIDLVVTQEGRRQMSLGNFRPAYASFSDKEVGYSDMSKSTSEASSKLYFQTPSALSSDQIIFETDDSGKMMTLESSEKFSIINDDVYLLTASNSLSGSSLDYLSVTGSQFASTTTLIKDHVLKAFERNKMIKTLSGFDLDSKVFKTNMSEHTFVISNSIPFPKGPLTEEFDIDHAETFMFDSKLAHNQNFMYMPPENIDGTRYGVYEDLRSLRRETFEDIKRGLNISVIPEYDKFQEDNTVLNYEGDLVIKNRAPNLPFDSTLISRECAQIYFTETSDHNNFIGQFFEEDTVDGKIKKLDIVDAGEFFDELDKEKPSKHVYYVGKVLFDTRNIPTFVNIFTVILD
jgi:hypothetical protein